MPVETDADRRLFVEEDDFAVPVSWTHSGGTANFPAIFDAGYQLVASPFLDGGAEGATPQLHACAADIPATAKQGDIVTVNGKTFSAVEIEPDGTGMTVIRLQDT